MYIHQANRTDLPLPYYRKRPTIYSNNIKSCEISLSSDSAELVSELSKTTNIDIILATAVIAVMQRYGLRDNIVIGMWDNTDKASLRPVYISLSYPSKIEDLRKTIELSYISGKREISTTLYDYEVGGDKNRNDLFDCAIIDGDAIMAPDLMQDITFYISQNHSIGAKFNSWLFDISAVENMLNHVLKYFEEAFKSPYKSILEVDYISDKEKKQLLLSGYENKNGKIKHSTINTLIKNIVDVNPNCIALIYGESLISYIELDQKVNQFSSRLISKGWGSGDKIGICVYPSVHQIIAVLAICRIGGTIVPIDWTLPVSRIHDIINISNIRFIVTSKDFRVSLPEYLSLLTIDECFNATDYNSKLTSSDMATPESNLYIMFTSGSTGVPKGIAMTHRAIVNLIEWQDSQTPIRNKRTLNRTSIAFDVGFQEILSTLCFGGELVIADDNDRSDISKLHKIILLNKISRVFLPPIALHQLAEINKNENSIFECLEWIIVAGEQLRITPAIIRLFRNNSATLINQYGPTETHVATYYIMPKSPLKWQEKPPIGVPIQNVQVFIADREMNLLPRGIVGEIIIGGICVSSGYINDCIDSSNFIDARKNGKIFYKTGDYGLLNNNGDLEFLCRFDNQIKFRGYRIELGDIEANASKIPYVSIAATKYWSDEKLAIYFQMTSELPDGLSNKNEIELKHWLRDELRNRVPDYMVPGINGICIMQNIPITFSGKVDRQKLLPPKIEIDITSISSHIEDKIKSIWLEHLELNDIAEDDDFLDLGGHSLLAIQVVSETNDLIGTNLPLATLLRGGTLGSYINKALSLSKNKLDYKADRHNEELRSFSSVVLPNGLEVVTPAPWEATYLWRDVVELNSYLRNGINLTKGGLVIDVGANIGIFSLHILESYTNIQVIAIEPSTELFSALSRNLYKFSQRVILMNHGCGDQDGEAILTYYPEVPGMSSFFPDYQKDRELLRLILKNTAQNSDDSLINNDNYLSERLRPVFENKVIKSLNSVFTNCNITNVALLKIDIQHGEENVLKGISDENWKIVSQIVIELQDKTNADNLLAFLHTKGFTLTMNQIEELHKGTDVYYVYGHRNRS